MWKTDGANTYFNVWFTQTVRKRRSQVIWGSFDIKQTHLMMKSVCDLSTCSVDSKDESSCLSTGSSEVSSIESRIKLRNQKSNEKLRVEGEKMKRKKESSRSSSIRRRAKDILEFLSSVSSSEVQIRQILGDSPDTSKALRMYTLLPSHTKSHTHTCYKFYPRISNTFSSLLCMAGVDRR